ncbi:MAG: hypothetical protein ACXAEU_02125 [Candidatus Hodarchaeales archaeon]|jgi:hypothetical protein
MVSVADVFRGAYLGLFVFAFLLIIAALDINTILDNLPNVLRVAEFIAYLMQVLVTLGASIGYTIAYSIYNVVFSIAYSLTALPGINIIVALITGIQPDGTGAPDGNSMNQLVGWMEELTTEIFPNPTFSMEDLEVVMDVIAGFINVLAFMAIVVAMAIAIFAVIGFITRGEAQLAITSFLGLQVIVILSMYIRMLNIDLTIPTSPFNDPNYAGQDPIGLTLIALIQLVQSEVFFMGLMLYLMLEFSFQSSYAMNIVDPMVARGRRITEHLNRVMTYVPGREGDKGGLETVGLSAAMKKKYGLLAASYIKEMIEKRMFKRKKGELDPKSMMRLQGFIGQIRRKDPRFDEQITAVSAAAQSKTILLYFLPLIIVRVSLVVVLSYIILNPSTFLDPLSNILGAIGLGGFETLLDSFELYQPEFRVAFLFNISLLLIVAGYLLHLRYARKEREEIVVERIDTMVEFDRATEAEAETELDEDEDAVIS